MDRLDERLLLEVFAPPVAKARPVAAPVQAAKRALGAADRRWP